MSKISKWRQTTSKQSKAEILNATPTGAIWDGSSLMATNGKLLAVPWKQVGTTVILPTDFTGKLPSGVPPTSLHGHGGNVIDLSFSPFHEDLLFTASEDCTIKGWKLPEDGQVSDKTEAFSTLNGHGKKVGILTFHHGAENVLASAGADGIVNMWDIETGKAGTTMKDVGEHMTSLNFNLDGSLLNTTTKDKKLTIVDSRNGNVVATTQSHDGSKAQKSVWAKRRNMIVTLGFTSQQYREVKVWDTRNLSKPAGRLELDQQTGVTMPFIDEDTGMLYVGGKGDGGIKYFDLWEDDANPIVALNAYNSNDAAKGLCMVPKRYMDVRKCELARFFKITTKSIVNVSFTLPRRACDVEFQEDVYPPTFAAEPSLSSKEFFEGKNAEPKVTDLRGLFDNQPLTTGGGSPTTASPVSPAEPAPKKEEPKKEEPKKEEPKKEEPKKEEPKKEEPKKEEPKKEQPKKEESKKAEPVSPATPASPPCSPATETTTAVANQQAIVTYLESQLVAAKAKLVELQKAEAAIQFKKATPPAASSDSDDSDI